MGYSSGSGILSEWDTQAVGYSVSGILSEWDTQ